LPFSKLELDLPAIQSAAPHPSQNRDPSKLRVLHLSQTIIGCVAGGAGFQTKYLNAKPQVAPMSLMLSQFNWQFRDRLASLNVQRSASNPLIVYN